MDEKTLAYYDSNAAEIAGRYESVPSPMERFFSIAFPSGARIIDVGCGSGRDAAMLLTSGFDAYGLEPVEGLRRAAVATHPELSGRIAEGALPAHGMPFGGRFDGVLCSAVLMHVPEAELLDAAMSIRELLCPRGRLLLSLPSARGDVLSEGRDAVGRLFAPYTAEAIGLLFERLGFQLIGRWDTDDALGRAGTSWVTMLLELRHTGAQRPVDQIEAILNRDRKEATYKLALFRALAEIATQEAHAAVWFANGEVGIPIDRVASLWLLYYWPIVASDKLIPQSKAEAAGGKPLKFRAQLMGLISSFEGQGAHGGLTSWHLAWASGSLPQPIAMQTRAVLRLIAQTVRDGPVEFSGGALESGRVFRFEAKTRLILMNAELWNELSLLGHWILDAVALRWAALTQQIGHRQGISAGDVLPLLLAKPEPTRATAVARKVFVDEGFTECTWSGKALRADFAVDHAIPFSLWGNNDLWNLLPADGRVNLSKSDKLPARELLVERAPQIQRCWEVLRDVHPTAFDLQARHLMGASPLPAGASWRQVMFSRFKEAVEMTALQRGVERWSP